MFERNSLRALGLIPCPKLGVRGRSAPLSASFTTPCHRPLGWSIPGTPLAKPRHLLVWRSLRDQGVPSRMPGNAVLAGLRVQAKQAAIARRPRRGPSDAAWVPAPPRSSFQRLESALDGLIGELHDVIRLSEMTDPEQAAPLSGHKRIRPDNWRHAEELCRRPPQSAKSLCLDGLPLQRVQDLAARGPAESCPSMLMVHRGCPFGCPTEDPLSIPGLGLDLRQGANTRGSRSLGTSPHDRYLLGVTRLFVRLPDLAPRTRGCRSLNMARR